MVEMNTSDNIRSEVLHKEIRPTLTTKLVQLSQRNPSNSHSKTRPTLTTILQGFVKFSYKIFGMCL